MESYEAWLEQVARLAMKVEWVIDPDDDYWRPKFERGLTHEEALRELWKDVNP